jgi:hypothetical protein
MTSCEVTLQCFLAQNEMKPSPFQTHDPFARKRYAAAEIAELRHASIRKRKYIFATECTEDTDEEKRRYEKKFECLNSRSTAFKAHGSIFTFFVAESSLALVAKLFVLHVSNRQVPIATRTIDLC